MGADREGRVDEDSYRGQTERRQIGWGQTERAEWMRTVTGGRLREGRLDGGRLGEGSLDEVRLGGGRL